MSTRKRRTRAGRPSADQAELTALLQRPSVESAEAARATFTLDDVSVAVRYWGDDPADRSGAKVSGGFGPNACLAIEVLTVMARSHEQTVACPNTSELAQIVGAALRATQRAPHAPIESVNDAIA